MAYTRRFILVLLLAVLFLVGLLHTRSVSSSDSRNLAQASSSRYQYQQQQEQKQGQRQDYHQKEEEQERLKGQGGTKNQPTKPESEKEKGKEKGKGPPTTKWFENYQPLYPVPTESMTPVPTASPESVPQVQYDFPATEDETAKQVRLKRLATVKETFQRSWKAYKKYAWKADEVGPLEGEVRTTFGGWGATLVDTLDTLWIMGLKDEFEEAVEAAGEIDFSTTETSNLNVFETTIRYLGGFLAANDLTEGQYPILLMKAVEVGDLLYVAFDTPNRFPVLRWEWAEVRHGNTQKASYNNVVAELGSLTMEFTRLSQVTGDPKYYDAIDRIMNFFAREQDSTNLPGLWPLGVDAAKPSFKDDNRFTFGGMSDSLYEYLPKQHLVLGGGSQLYRQMYEKAINVAKQMMFFRPQTKDGDDDVLIPGTLITSSDRRAPSLQAEGQHLTCFAGGMVALGAQIFNRPDELEIGRKLTEGCIWAYRSTPTGIMPEIFRALPCKEGAASCKWDPRNWFQNSHKYKKMSDDQIATKAEQANMVPGFLTISDKSYILRPEAIESVFLLYRMTGDTSLQDKGWDMFTAIEKQTRTEIAYAGIDDVTSSHPRPMNTMESFWTGETLKYFYLLYSEPDLVSLDKYVFNSEAHPFLTPA